MPKTLVKIQASDVVMDHKETPPADVVVLEIGGKVVGTLGNIVAITGKPGMGKSLFLQGILASSATIGPVWGCKINRPEGRGKIAYFDTEQTRTAVKRAMDNIASLAMRENFPPYIDVYILRLYDPAQIIDFIMDTCKDPEISIVVIDGFSDLVENMNSEVEVFGVTSFVKKLTAERNVLVIGVVHQTKRDGYSLGHMGSAIDRYAESTMSVDKDKSGEFIQLTPLKMRNSLKTFAPITITEYDGHFNVVDVDITAKKVKEENRSAASFSETEHKYLIQEVIPEAGITYGKLVKEVQEAKGVTESKAKTFVKVWREKKYIYKNHDDIYFGSVDKRMFVVKDNDSPF